MRNSLNYVASGCFCLLSIILRSFCRSFFNVPDSHQKSVTACLSLARFWPFSACYVLLLLSASLPEINSSLLAVLFLLFATRFLFLIPCHLLLSVFRMPCSLFPGCYSRVILYFLLSSNPLFAGINSMSFIVNPY